MERKMIVLGLCGRSGSGKSTVAAVFSRLGVKGVDCDELTHEVYAIGGECLKALSESFGAEILGEDGALDRKALAQRAFATVEGTELLNRITHGFILKALEEKLRAFEECGKKMAFIDAPLLFEAGLEKRVDAVIGVIASEGESIKRVAERDGMTEAEVRARLEKQKSTEFLKSHSALRIYNAGSLRELEKKSAKALLWAMLRFRVPMLNQLKRFKAQSFTVKFGFSSL